MSSLSGMMPGKYFATPDFDTAAIHQAVLSRGEEPGTGVLRNPFARPAISGSE